MKHLVLILAALVLGTSSTMAATAEDKVATRNAYNYNNSFIFVENGITFSVYPDGEFDFYIDNRSGVGVSAGVGHTNITFNSGYDYNPYVQYDDYGAVIQVENVPIYYDYYGRVTQVGDVDIFYRNGRVNRLGGLYVYYDNRGYYSHHSGFINVYNRHYVYRPFHGLFIRPALGFCLVFNSPYRRYYNPVRYTYYTPYRYNTRRAYAKVGNHYNYNKQNKRSTIYRNDKRVVARENGTRSSDGLRSSSRTASRDNKSIRNNRSVTRSGNDGLRSSNRVASRDNKSRNSRSIDRGSSSDVKTNRTTPRANPGRVQSADGKTVQRGSTANTRSTRSSTARKVGVRNSSSDTKSTVARKEVSRTSGNKTATRSNSVNRKPVERSRANRSVERTSTKRTVAARPAQRTARSSKATVSRSSASKRNVSKAPARSSKNTNKRSSRTKVH